MNKYLLLLLFISFSLSSLSQPMTDNERLEIAIDYFQSGKYQESLNIFEQLEKNHKLNPRYVAYMGLCYYYEWDFKKAAAHLEKAIPQLQMFSPHELSIYHFACAESYFALEKYEESLPHYENALSLCYDNEKGDIYFRLGYCYVLQEEWQQARTYLQLSRDFYLNHRDTTDLQARLRQIDNMIEGCSRHIESDSVEIVTDE